MADYSYLQHVMEENDKLRKELDSMRVAYNQAVATIEQMIAKRDKDGLRVWTAEEKAVLRELANKAKQFDIVDDLLSDELWAGDQRLTRAADEILILRDRIEDLLPWARLGARTGVTDSSWDDAQRLLTRIESGEFGEIR